MKAIVIRANHLKGISKKTGKPYDFTPSSLIVHDNRFGKTSLKVIEKTMQGAPPVGTYPALVEIETDLDGNISDWVIIAGPEDVDFIDFLIDGSNSITAVE